MTKYLKNVPILNGILFTLYTAMVIALGVYMHQFRGWRRLGLCFILLVIVFAALWPLIYRGMEGFRRSGRAGGEGPDPAKGRNIDLTDNAGDRMSASESDAEGRKKKLRVNRTFLLYSVLTCMILLIWYIALFPGLFSPDSITQYEQVVTGEYSDWHPVIHTLFTFARPLGLTGGWMGSVVLFQILEFSLASGYAFAVLQKHTGKRFAIPAFVWLMINPIVGNMLMYPWKDVTFACSGMLLSAMALEIAVSRGKWLDGRAHRILLAVLLAFATLLRHNAMLFTIPVLCGILLFRLTKKQRIQILVIFIAAIFVVRYPLYTVLDVEQPDQRQVETVGLPMIVIGNVVVNDPDALDEETKAFVYSFATEEEWNTYYSCGNFNAIKWQETSNLDVVDEISKADLIRMMVKSIIASPLHATQGLFTTIGFVLIPTIRFEWPNGMYMNIHEANIPVEGPEGLRNLLVGYSETVGTNIVYYIFASIGFLTLLLAVLIVLKWNVLRGGNWKYIFMAGSILVHNWGTMLLLSGFDLRFFFITITVTPFLIALIWKADTENERRVQK